MEFDRHDHALAALRQLNNNPAAFSADRRPIVEFAIENVKVRALPLCAALLVRKGHEKIVLG